MAWWKSQRREKTIDEHLEDIQRGLALKLADDEESSPGGNKEKIMDNLLAIEKLQEIQARRAARQNKESFLASPAGVALLTGLLTITASQIPALIQAQSAERAARTEAMKPLLEAISQDTSIDLRTKLALISAVASGERVEIIPPATPGLPNDDGSGSQQPISEEEAKSGEEGPTQAVERTDTALSRGPAAHRQ